MGEVKYTEDHKGIRIDGEVGTVGITNFAQEQLGDTVNADAESGGWFFKIKITDASELDSLMDKEAYKAFIA